MFSGSNYSIDVPRIFKSAFTTAIASAAPTYGTPSESVLNAFGSLAIGLDASAINAVIEIILTNLFS